MHLGISLNIFNLRHWELILLWLNQHHILYSKIIYKSMNIFKNKPKNSNKIKLLEDEYV